ncbi:hypothetical protein FQN50_000393 [Emmonsiellopsis sp. PD_5]|nr:hypothetical protein FQN50_000393 [Emmonsiellopsis sp. PD_5]
MNWVDGFGSIDGKTEKYLPESKLKAYFSDRNLRNLLSEAFPERPKEKQSAREAIQRGYYKCFAVLLYLKVPQYVQRFAEHVEYHDEKLPCYNPPRVFPVDPSGNISFEKFSDCQWKFCVPALEYREYTVRQEKILPFKILESIRGGEGGSGRLYKIQVDPEYNKLHPNVVIDPNTNSHIYALKYFKNISTAEEECRKEIEGFKSVCQGHKCEEGIVGFYGGFCHNGAHSILLEYANEGSLEDYFQSGKKPQDTLSFWWSFVPISKAIDKIHNSVIDDTVYEGWHQDIKPNNILVFSRNGKLTLKLSDFGLIRCVRKEPDGVCRRRCSYGTRTYGAPECRVPTLDGATEPLRRVTGSIDVWSFACVLSESAVYFEYSREELERYRNSRREKGALTRDCDSFHNGYRVLDIVETTHQDLRDKADDVLTIKVLDLIKTALVPEQYRPLPQKFYLDMLETFSQFRSSKHPRSAEEYDGYPMYSTHPFHQGVGEPRCHPSPSSTCSGSRSTSVRRSQSGRRPPSERQSTLGTTQPRAHQDYHSFTADGANLVPSPTGMCMSQSPNSVSSPDIWNNGSAKYPLYASGAAEHMPGDRGAESSMDQGSTRHSYEVSSPNRPEHVFLVDDASSMRQHWDQMTRNIRTLAYMVKKSDDDGLDLQFMISDNSLQHITTSSKLFTHVQSRIPSHPGQFSNIDNALGTMLTGYQNKLTTTKKKRPMSIYVFTDGIWQDHVNIHSYIRNLARDLDSHNMPPNQFGIQFIQFGNNPSGTRRLQNYDDCLSDGQSGYRTL